MQRMSLPIVLQKALKQHVDAADIDNDEELKTIMLDLNELSEKVELVKQKALENKQRRKRL